MYRYITRKRIWFASLFKLCKLYAADISTMTNAILNTFADDTGILAIYEDSQEAVKTLQKYIKLLENWLLDTKI